MLALTAQIAMHVAILATTTNNYETAYEQAAKQHKPLLVLVGADWCPACRTMKEDSLPALVKKGDLNKLAFTMVNADDQPKLARQLMDGNSVPQLILYTPTAKGWHRAQLTGAYAPDEIRRFIKREISDAKKRQETKVAQIKTPESS